MKKLGLITTAVLFLALQVEGQEYKISASGVETLKIMEVNKVEVEGYDGNEIVFSTKSSQNRNTERAEGLTAISSMGLLDNSGIGLSVEDKGGIVEVFPMSKRTGRKYLIKVPNNVKVYYEHSTSYGSRITIRNVSSEIEISTNHNSVILEDVTGPMTINTVHGKIEATFSSVSQTNPVSIVSVHGLVDVAIPANTKANLKMSSNWGEIYTDMDIEFDRNQSELRSNSNKVKGKLNGGGVAMNLSSSHNNVYLRVRK